MSNSKSSRIKFVISAIISFGALAVGLVCLYFAMDNIGPATVRQTYSYNSTYSALTTIDINQYLQTLNYADQAIITDLLT